MVFNRKFVEVGRVAYIVKGVDSGKLCVIIDVIDQNRALIDGPCSGVLRKAINFNSVHLTRFVIKIRHSARTIEVKRAWDTADITGKWSQTKWAQKIMARQKRAMMTDFDRFKLMRAKQARNRIVTQEFKKLKKKQKVDRKLKLKSKPKTVVKQ
ncbi:ribosomal L14-like [Octopus vulgaris]|uniref:Ribosomal L14-like n=2 Tax=Octopus TaxID=6643 RepID=A0AA36F6M2_OCTVU|nr:60S ribosomal protein L14 isoform X1 [Octopus sinensis]XP_036359928.1 60S ribosomal protein L14 isoform X2 [Octopus sinensis]CAI9724178.1 ribosomal L14-like [Octopus vulgaris]